MKKNNKRRLPIIVALLITVFVFSFNFLINSECNKLRLTFCNDISSYVAENSLEKVNNKSIFDNTSEYVIVSASCHINNNSLLPMKFLLPICLDNNEMVLVKESPEAKCETYIGLGESSFIPIRIIMDKESFSNDNPSSVNVYYLYYNGIIGVGKVKIDLTDESIYEYNESN